MTECDLGRRNLAVAMDADTLEGARAGYRPARQRDKISVSRLNASWGKASSEKKAASSASGPGDRRPPVSRAA